MVNAQEWLDKEYPKENRKNITELDIKEKYLEGHLDLKDFTNLKVLFCYENKLTSIDLKGLNKLEKVYCSNNYLTNFDYSVLNPDKLIWLIVMNNNLPEQDLAVFSKFVNLEALWIGGYEKNYFSQNIYNKFSGSLEPLKNLTKLENLHISNTDINNGLEYLPNSIEVFHCQASERLESKVGILEMELSPFVTKKRGKIVKMYNLPAWRKANQEMVEVAKILSNLELALTDGIITDPITDKFLQVFIFQMQERLIELWKNKHQELQTQIEIPSKK